MNILDEIIASKQKEIEKNRAENPISKLEDAVFFQREPISLRERLTQDGSSQIIAEFKRRSPSKGNINDRSAIGDVTVGYQGAGCAGISILTDQPYFGGSPQDIMDARDKIQCPILRKDFIIDEYQIIEARAMGADVILLISEALTEMQIDYLSSFAKSLHLDVLLEMHSADQLEKVSPHVDLVGVNNRNLKTFEVSIETSLQLAELIPAEFVKISESGISNPQNIRTLRQAGYQGFLIGENFMKTPDPGLACQAFISAIQPTTS